MLIRMVARTIMLQSHKSPLPTSLGVWGKGVGGISLDHYDRRVALIVIKVRDQMVSNPAHTTIRFLISGTRCCLVSTDLLNKTGIGV